MKHVIATENSNLKVKEGRKKEEEKGQYKKKAAIPPPPPPPIPAHHNMNLSNTSHNIASWPVTKSWQNFTCEFQGNLQNIQVTMYSTTYKLVLSLSCTDPKPTTTIHLQESPSHISTTRFTFQCFHRTVYLGLRMRSTPPTPINSLAIRLNGECYYEHRTVTDSLGFHPVQSAAAPTVTVLPDLHY